MQSGGGGGGGVHDRPACSGKEGGVLIEYLSCVCFSHVYASCTLHQST